MDEEPVSQPGTERVRVRVKVKKRRQKPWYKRRQARIWLAVAAAILGLLILDGLWAAVTIQRGLTGARDNLKLGAESLQSGDLATARTRFLLAESQSSSAADALGHPATLLARALPLVGDDARAVRTLGNAAVTISSAGVDLVDAANDVGWTGDGAAVIQPGGRIDVDGIAAAAPRLATASGLVQEAQRELSGVDTASLMPLVREAAIAARSELDRVSGITDAAAGLAGFLPEVLGAGGQRSYLVIVMTLADPRGSGGYPGAYGTLRVTDGALSLDYLAPTSDVPVVDPVRSQAVPQKRYIRFGALSHFIATTYSPDFPETGALVADMWNAAGKPPVDGVVGVDSRWMSYLLAATGPISVVGQPAPLTADNVSDVIDRQTLETMSKETSDRMQLRLGSALFNAVLSGGADPALLGEGMSRAVAERHFQVWMTREDEQLAARALGATGDFVLGDNPLAISWDGTVNSRAGFFALKDVSYSAQVQADGSAEVTIEISVRNFAPDGPPSILLGDGKLRPVGYYSANASIYLPVDAQDISSEPTQGTGFINIIERQFGHPLAFQHFGAASGGMASARVSYTIPPPEEPGTFDLHVTPLPALRPETVTVSVKTPLGASPHTSTPGASIGGGVVTWHPDMTQPSSLHVDY